MCCGKLWRLWSVLSFRIVIRFSFLEYDRLCLERILDKVGMKINFVGYYLEELDYLLFLS